MNFATTLLFYVLVGAAVAGAVLLRNDGAGRGDRLFRAATAFVFWPIYLPLLLQNAAPRAALAVLGSTSEGAAPAVADELGGAITQVEAELDVALGSLDGWSGGVLAREQDRFAELRSAWRQQAARIAELDRLLVLPTFHAGEGAAEPLAASPRAAASDQARRENIQRLQTIRRRMRDDLLGTLAKVRELATMIHLARYTGAPAARAEELVEEIAAAVAGLSEVAEWRETMSA